MKWSSFCRDWTWWKQGNENDRKLVNLPHDAMLTEKRIPRLKEGAASGYFPGGTYVYEKIFQADPLWKEQTVMLEFEGVYQKSAVYLNGEKLGGWVYGYTNFYVDLTDKLSFEKENVLRVVADNSQTPNSRWYTGSGIYRPVHLITGSRQHILPDGVKILTKSYAPAVISVSVETTELTPGTQIVLRVRKNGEVLAEAEGALCELSIPEPELWSADCPNLYELDVRLQKDGVTLDTVTERFGIRKLAWSAKTGLLCNGTPVKLRGGCVHHDNGPLGACEFDGAARRRVRILREAGYNAIRSAHNPISKAMLRACDELGMYVMDEAFDMWLRSKNEYDYSLCFEEEHEKDIAAMIRKDFNHPSVILYSIGNEIGDLGFAYGHELHKAMVRLCHDLDSSRPVTNAENVMVAIVKPSDKPKPVYQVSRDDAVDPCREEASGKATGSKLINYLITLFPLMLSKIKAKTVKNNLGDALDNEDIVGLNYGDHLMEELHALAPEHLLLNTETFPRKIGKNWPVVLRNDCLIGDFMWTAWDYLGEVGIGVVLYGKQPKQFSKPYPCIAAGIGSVDLIGTIESQGYYASVVWGCYDKPYIGVRPVNHSGEKTQLGQWRGTDTICSWTWPGCEGKEAEIHVFSQGVQVELLLNGSSLGRTQLTDCIATFKTPYRPGTLTAISYDAEGKELSRSGIKTAEEETHLTVIPEKTELTADGEDLAYIRVAVTDPNGIVKNLEQHMIRVRVNGAAVLQAVGSGNPVTEESYLGSAFTTHNGQMLAIVRSGYTAGTASVTISAEGIGEETVSLAVRDAG